MHYLLRSLVQALRHMNDRDLVASIIIGILLFIAGILDLYWRTIWLVSERILQLHGVPDVFGHTIKEFHFLKHYFC